PTAGLVDPLNSELVMENSGGGPLVATRRIGNHYVVDLGFSPLDVYSGSGDGARLMANALLYSMQSPPDFPPAPFYFQVNSHNNDLGNGDWYSSDAAGNGANFLQIHVPTDWPTTAPLVVDLLSPDMNNAAVD